MRRYSALPATAGASVGAIASISLPSAAGPKIMLPSESPAASEVHQAVALKKQLVGRVKEDPQAASRLIQNWLRQGEGEPSK